MQALDAPDASRIASILRAQDAWPVTSIDLAHRLATQQRQLVDKSDAFRLTTPSALVQIPLAGSAEAKVAQLAERVQQLVTALQKRCDEDKEELEQQMDKIHARLEARMGALERGEDGTLGREATWLREARSMIGAALTEAQGQWRQELAQMKGEQRQQLGLLEELADASRQSSARMEKAERALQVHERSVRRSEEQLKAIGKIQEVPPWYAQLEGAIVNVERQVNEQQVAVEVQVARLQVECDGLRRRAEVLGGMREEILQAMDEKVAGCREPLGSAKEDRCGVLLKRCDELDARLASQKVHVEAHEQRFRSFAERLEGLQQEVFDLLHEGAQKRREELLTEVDGQMRVLRERMDTLSELMDELMLRQASDARKGPGGRFMRSALPRLSEEF